MTQARTSNDPTDLEPVIVVGGGPVGLSASLELARCGLRSVLIEKNERTSWHPKTRNFNTRTMEIARGWGREIYDELCELDLPTNWKSPIRFLESIVGKETGHVVSEGFVGAGPDRSPVSSVLSSQDMIEPVLARENQRTGMVDLRFNHELVEIVRGQQDDADSVQVRVKNRATEEVYSLVAPALVAADGAASFVRNDLEVPLDGPMKIAHFINCYFRADIERFVGDRTGILFFVANSKGNGVFQPLDARGRWLTQISVPEDQWSPEIFTAERCTEWIRNGVGVQDLPVEVLSIGKWQMNAVVARKLIHGRILLMGDAAHMFPPTGGLGVNTGIQTMHNGIWKLALYLRKKAGRGLLETFETERRPVARWVADQSLQNSRQVQKLAAISRGEVSEGELAREEVLQATRRYGNHVGLELGTVYESPAVIPDGSSSPRVEDPYTDYVPSGHPGVRAPHVWLEREGERLSSIDLVGPEFSLIASAGGQEWQAIAEATGKKLGLELECHPLGEELVDVEGTFEDRFGLSDTGAVLLRPDGFIAWRATELQPSAARDLENALSSVLMRT